MGEMNVCKDHKQYIFFFNSLSLGSHFIESPTKVANLLAYCKGAGTLTAPVQLKQPKQLSKVKFQISSSFKLLVLQITLNWVGVQVPSVTLWGDMWKSKPYLEIPCPTTVPERGFPTPVLPLLLSLLAALFQSYNLWLIFLLAKTNTTPGL